MAVAPHRRVVKATITVLVFWTLVALAYSAWTNLPLMLYRVPEIPWRVSWIVVVFLLSAGLSLAYDVYHIFRVTLGLRPMQYRGAETTLGILPSPISPDRTRLSRKDRENRLKTLLDMLSPDPKDPRLNREAIWQLAQQKGGHADLFWAVFSILDASKLPASPVKGSHGDTLLITHSLRVAAAMARLWGNATTPMMPNDVTKPAQSRPYDLHTAIVAGLAHDLGKVRCFRRGKDGSITVVGLHDMVGGRLLATLPEFWGLLDSKGQYDDYTQKLLSQGIRYYHHPGAYPGSGLKRSFIQTDEGIRALMLAIHDADMVAGAIEGRTNEIMADYLDEEELPERDLAEQIWETFLMLMDEESMINSKSPQKRIAYKQGKIIFLIENKMRTLICDHLSLTRVDYTSNNNGNPGKIIQIIAARLDEKGLIKKDFSGRVCNKPWGAGVYLQVEGLNKDGDASEAVLKLPHYLIRITEDGPFAKYAGMEDYPSKISIKALTWPQYFKAEETGTDTGAKPPKAPTESQPDNQAESRDQGTNRPTETEPASSQEEPATEDESESEPETDPLARDTPPDDEPEDAYAGDHENDAGHETEAGLEDDPFAVPAPEPVEETEPQEATQAPAPVAVAAPADAPAPQASPSDIEEKKRLLERARERANLPREEKRMVKRETETPEEKQRKLIERTSYFWKKYPDILKSAPEQGDLGLDKSDRLKLLMGVIWMEQARRDVNTMTSIPSGNFQKISLHELFHFPLEDKAGKAALMALQKLGAGRITIVELQVRIVVQMAEDGKVDLGNSFLFAPINSEIAPEQENAG
ncbi:metal-dependent phosphohydrolase [Acidithiobacillus sp.]|uniref:metal-dependent phosphohydrolase n=1 Tax=Acidithiobacillus sp. TaxID=1872118 RepID=UPI0026130A09|nr:metal-dependent phosphohydrolase [Acidithiobacillus sp.]MDD5281002.1 metal-dependent phosphohydrolase [Acidithiobacillus sp.]